MNRNRIITIVAVVCGFLAFAIVFNQMQKSKIPLYRVVIAKQAIKPGTVLTEAMLDLSKPVRGVDIKSYYVSVNDAVGLKVNTAIEASKAVTRSSTQKSKQDSAEEDGPQLLPIPQGMSAMSLSAKEVDQIPEYLTVGNYVDLIGYASKNSESQSIIVYSAQVLSLTREAAKESKDKTNAETRKPPIESVTLALTADEAEILTSSTRRGKVRMMARSSAGIKPVTHRSKGSMEVIRGSAPPQVVSFDTTSSSQMQVVNAPGSDASMEQQIEDDTRALEENQKNESKLTNLWK